MWIMAFAFRIWHNLIPGEANKGMWRIPDGKVGERSVFMFGALRW
jgi:hypothetical protein